jgi:hypothetical protein
MVARYRAATAGKKANYFFLAAFFLATFFTAFLAAFFLATGYPPS